MKRYGGLVSKEKALYRYEIIAFDIYIGGGNINNLKRIKDTTVETVKGIRNTVEPHFLCSTKKGSILKVYTKKGSLQ